MSNEASYTNTVSTGSPPRFVDIAETINNVGDITWRNNYFSGRTSGIVFSEDAPITSNTFTTVYSGSLPELFSDSYSKISSPIVIGNYLYYCSSNSLIRVDMVQDASTSVSVYGYAWCYFNNSIWVVKSGTSTGYVNINVYNLQLGLINTIENIDTRYSTAPNYNLITHKNNVYLSLRTDSSTGKVYSFTKTYTKKLIYNSSLGLLYGKDDYIYVFDMDSSNFYLKQLNLTSKTVSTTASLSHDFSNTYLLRNWYYANGGLYLRLDVSDGSAHRFVKLLVSKTGISLQFSKTVASSVTAFGENSRYVFYQVGSNFYYCNKDGSGETLISSSTKLYGTTKCGTTLYFLLNNAISTQTGSTSYLTNSNSPVLNGKTNVVTATGLVNQLDNIIAYTSTGDYGFNWDSSVAPTANGVMYAKFLNECRQIIDDLRNEEGSTMTTVNTYDPNNCTSSTCVFNCTAGCYGACANNCASDGCTNRCTVSCVGGFIAPCFGCSGSCNAWCSTVCSGTCGHTVCVNQCSKSCTWVCSGNCIGYCYKTCSLSCYSVCANSARLGNPPSGCYLEACSGTCVGTCEGTCTGGCLTTCTGGCDTTCVAACKNDCTGACMDDCTGSCTGVSY